VSSEFKRWLARGQRPKTVILNGEFSIGTVRRSALYHYEIPEVTQVGVPIRSNREMPTRRSSELASAASLSLGIAR